MSKKNSTHVATDPCLIVHTATANGKQLKRLFAISPLCNTITTRNRQIKHSSPRLSCREPSLRALNVASRRSVGG